MSAQTALPPDSEPVPTVPDSGALEPKKKKHRSGGTLRRALSWLRGRKKKKPEAKQQHDRKDNSVPDGQSQPIPAQEQESADNAFFPSRRTAHVEDIHNQAQEGLKSLQRREKQHNKNAVQEESKTPEPSTEATDENFRTRSLSCATENTDDSMSVRSEMIQRKGSTFRPHDSPSWSASKAGRRRREKRATVVGVPQHIAAELGLHTPTLHRGIHELFSKGEGQSNEKTTAAPVVNGVHKDGEEYVVIPTVDGLPAEAPLNGAHVSLAAVKQTEAALQRHIEKVYQDDSYIGWKTSHKNSPLLIRPKSVAVPGMTTHSPHSDPVSPVMSISPQGTYMSKIIPNAILPPMVDVVALSKSSVRTLSRCSLASASPSSIRGSLHRGRGMSMSSETWSRSQSTETIVSDSSTISSRGGDHTLDVSDKHESGLSTGRASPAPSTGTQDESDAASLCSGRSSVRSVSLRKSKKAPPPPKRTYSLQQQREMGLPPRPDKKSSTKTSNNRDPWVPRAEKATLENEVFSSKVSSPTRSDRTLSPSSGYSSQSGTPTLPVRSLLESPGTRRRTPPKPERSSLKSASSNNASSLSAENKSPILASPPRAGSSMGDQEGQDIIPPHPNVPAPTCPPPIQSNDFVVTPSATPAPSPPPSHHPTPPPVRKSESDAEIPQSALEEGTQKESSWPPPPPEAPDVQDLSMADFPPPEEELFLPPPPSLEPVSENVTTVTVYSNDNKDVTEAEKPPLTSKIDMPLDMDGTQPHTVPLRNTKPPEAVVNSVDSETPSTSVCDSEKDIQQPVVPPTIVAVVVPSAEDNSEERLIETIAYKPHFVATTVAETAEPKEKHTVSVPQDTSRDQSVHKQEPTVVTDNPASIVSPSPVASASITPSPTVTTSLPLSPVGGSPLQFQNQWKPVSAPSTRKPSLNNHGTTPQPKDDANLPIVTPSLLQMVRLRSVQARTPQIPYSQLPSGIPAPQKPVRKSLSSRSSLGSDSSPGESPTAVQPSPSPQKPPDSPTAHRSPASAASFVFARGSKKFVFEPHVAQEAESSQKRDLAAELKTQGGPRSPDGKPPIQRKPSKIPPPVARKPSVGIPRTPTSPSIALGGTNGNIVTPHDAVSVPPLSGTSTSGTLEKHEQQLKSPMEQA